MACGDNIEHIPYKPGQSSEHTLLSCAVYAPRL